MSKWLTHIWDMKCIRNGKVVWEELNKENIVPDEGELAVLEVFYRNKASVYFPDNKFYIGLYNGDISESTTLVDIPNEPNGNGYSRRVVDRDVVGWPVVEKYEGDWRVESKELTMEASGGDIGPINGAFIATTSDNTGVLIGAVATKVERTILPGDKVIFKIRAKHK